MRIHRSVRIFLAAMVACGASIAAQPDQAAGANAALIQWFAATPSTIVSGSSTTLRWHVDGANTVSVDQGIGPVPSIGTTTVSPTTTTTYTLSATGDNGSAQRQHTVVVGPNPTVSGGRFVRMVSPVGGQRFTAPATLRTFAAGFDPAGTNCGAGGNADRCASRVDFYVDNTLMAQVPAAQSEYWVFKATFGGVGAGVHRVWARAIYTNPAATLDSESVWITVENPPVYAQTIDLAQDVVLSGAQHYELLGSASPGGRIRLNGHGHRIRSSGGWSGRLTLDHVDVFDLGVLNNATPGIEVATGNTVRVENSIFDTTSTIALNLSGSASATIRGNTFRSNMWMPASQQPEFEPGASYPAFRASGGSTAPKFFQGNDIGLGWADFRNADNWLIGGDEEGDGNVVIGPRTGIWAQNMSRSRIVGNIVYHIYFGGWSQGNVMELGGSEDIVVEHNVIGGGSWPIRGLGGTLRYNLVLDAGHQWLWVTGDNAHVHHNVFVGGDGDVAPIWLIYGPQDVNIHNNTLDGLNQSSMIRPVRMAGDGVTAQLRSNAIVNMRNPPAVEIDGTLVADYNLFSGQLGNTRNYSDNRHPAHDVGVLNAQVDPQFLEVPEPLRYRWDELWTRSITARQVLANYRTRYTPGPGSPLIDAGDPGTAVPGTIMRSSFEDGESADTSNPGNDIGAVGSGAAAMDDQFGR
jgi:hypothetical protein